MLDCSQFSASMAKSTALTTPSLLLKLTAGQFENANIKTKNAKLRYPPSADGWLYDAL
jgi:hypothetical protein